MTAARRAPLADPLYIEAHLGYLFDKALGTQGVVVISEPGPKGWRSDCFPVGELDRAARHLAARSDAGANMFVRNNLLGEPISAYRRGTKAQTGWVTSLAGDVDIAGPGHQPAADGLPLPSRDGAEAICHALLTPSYIVFSGGGFYPFWRLTEAWDVRDPEARADYLALDRAWGRSIAEVGRRAGYHVDMVGDGTRVLRSVGTVNHKPARGPRLVTVHLGHLCGGGDYTIEEVRRACVAPTSSIVRTTPRTPRRAGGATVWDTFAALYTLADVLEGDRRFGPWKCVDDRDGYDLWRRADATSDYSLKQAHDSGVVIVWSGVVAAALGIEPGDGLDLFGFACKLEGVDPRRKAADIMRLARTKRRAAV
jgi:hypothetical protein